MAAKPWMKLDLDFWRDPKVKKLIAEKGEAAAFRLVKLWCLAYGHDAHIDILGDGVKAEVHGALDLRDKMTRIDVEDEMGVKGKRLDALVEACVECGLFKRDMWECFGVVTSDRLAIQGEGMARSLAQKREAGLASAAARASKR